MRVERDGWGRRGRRRRPRPAVLLAGAVLGALTVGATACFVPAGRTAAATETARAAVRAASAEDTAALCALLAPSTVRELEQERSQPCAQAARSVDLDDAAESGPAQVWGSSALVPTGSRAVFLTDVDGRWRVLAAGCTLHADSPADCALGGS